LTSNGLRGCAYPDAWLLGYRSFLAVENLPGPVTIFFGHYLLKVEQYFDQVLDAVIAAAVECIGRSKSSDPQCDLTQWCTLIIMNDCIRQTISSPISLSKIFIASTTSTPALVSRMSKRVCMFRIFLEQRTVIRFVKLKGPCASAIAAELKSVYETEVLTFSRGKKWCKCFAERRTSL
jgi:hypothetical protein